jgi:hypothetical protein
MVRQQVDVARSQCPMGRAAELAFHLAHSHTPCLCGSHEPRHRSRRSSEAEINFVSLDYGRSSLEPASVADSRDARSERSRR